MRSSRRPLVASWSGPARCGALLVMSALALALPVLGDPLPERSARVVDYQIAVRLDAEKGTLDGRERIVWRNPSADAVPDLWFHLYLNAFASSESTFFRESGGKLRRSSASEEGWGWIDVTAIRLADGTDLLPHLTFERPDDGNSADRTVARVTLPRAVAAQGQVELEVEFAAKLPEVYARTGRHGDFFLVGQWFPKLGVYEPAGMRGRTQGGWNCHQFHAHSEFYADFGSYRVELTVPSRFVVGATGERQAREDHADGTTTYRYAQDDVHDFAWTADPRFVEIEDRFVAEREVPVAELAATAERLGRSIDEVRLGDVAIRLLLQPSHLPQADRHLRAAKLGLARFGLWYGRYPYRTLTIVDPPKGGDGAGGMEYPTFITAGTSFLLNRGPLEKVRMPEIVVVHEFAHQYWQGMVASNEFEESWLDEGFASYSEVRAMEAGYGAESSSGELFGLRVSGLDLQRVQNGPERRFDRIRTPSWGFSTSRNYSFNSYGRPALVLRTLAGILGEVTMARVMRTYHERWRFRHPSSDDFFAVAEEVAGRELKSYFGQVVDGPGILDDAVTQVTSEPIDSPRGRVERDGRLEMVTGKQARDLDDAAERAGQQRWRSRVELRRLGEVQLPVVVELTFRGVAPERRVWPPGERWARWEFERAEPLVSAQLDPDHLLPLDADWTNNARRVELSYGAALHWSARLVFWIQQVLVGLAL